LFRISGFGFQIVLFKPLFPADDGLRAIQLVIIVAVSERFSGQTIKALNSIKADGGVVGVEVADHLLNRGVVFVLYGFFDGGNLHAGIRLPQVRGRGGATDGEEQKHDSKSGTHITIHCIGSLAGLHLRKFRREREGANARKKAAKEFFELLKLLERLSGSSAYLRAGVWAILEAHTDFFFAFLVRAFVLSRSLLNSNLF
jgi:hypothetical protein